MPLLFQSGVGTLNLFGSYASDAAFVTANGTATNGYAYYNTTSNTVRAYINSAWIDVQAGALNPSLIYNLSIATSVGSNALTISFNDASGNGLSASSPALVGFRNGTATTGTYSYVAASSISSLTIPSATTIGTSSGVPTYIYVYLINNAGTLEAACSLFGGFDEAQLQSSTLITGGASATTLYSAAARSTKAIRLIGRIQISEVTAGTWITAPTEVSPWPFRTAKQVVVGTAQTANSTATSFTLATLTNSPTVSFTAVRTGYYRVYGTIIGSNDTNGDGFIAQINGTSGSPTTVFAALARATTSASGFIPMTLHSIFQLTAGTAYTFALQFAATVGGTATLQNSIPANGQAIIAEEL